MSAPEHFDVLVLGVGGMGAAALAHLASRGVRVVGVEQHSVPNDRGSSTGETRVIRKAYFEDARYVPILQRAYTLWNELEKHTGDELFVRTGCLNFGPPDNVDIRGVRESVALHGLPHDSLDERAIGDLYPAFVPGDGDVGIFEQDAGFLRVEACTDAHARRAVASGAMLLGGRKVVTLDVSDRLVTAHLDDGKVLSADRAVVSAGPWLASAPGLAKIAARLPLRVTRQVQLYFRPEDPEIVAVGSMPVFIHFGGEHPFYGVPLHAEDGAEPALKICQHGGGDLVTTPDDVDREVHDRDVAPVRAWLRDHLPDGDGELVRARVCMYTSTPDGHFVIGALRAMPNVIVLGGFSGHGYKMASVIGEIAADLAMGRASPFDLGLFSPERF